MQMPFLRIAGLTLALIGCASLSRAEPVATERTSANTPFLRELLDRFPAADVDANGVLTEAEARAYQQRMKGAAAPPATNRVAPTLANVSYGPHARNLLDFWKAEAPKPTPAIVYIHGGGFRAGDKSNVSPRDIQRALREGVSFAAINYRFHDTAPLSDILRDIARAIQFLRSKAADWNIDKPHVAAYGGSAGAGSSLWLAFHDDLAAPDSADPVLRESTRLVAAAAVSTQASYDLTRWPEVLGMDAETVFARVEAGHAGLFRAQDPRGPASPKAMALRRDLDMLGHASKDDPPVCVINAGEDVVPGDVIHHPRHAKAVKQRCDELGIECVLVTRETPTEKRVSAIDFLIGHLKPAADAAPRR
jgi:acetyl esterase/lipase